jgi:hypothetical protein
MRQGRLRDMQAFGSLNQASQFTDGDQQLQMTAFNHGNPLIKL